MTDFQNGKQFITGDTRMTKAEEDRLMSSGDLIEITPEQLADMAARAAEVKLTFDAVAMAGMTRARAERIRELRATSSWRVVAAITHKEWGEDALWEPETNQLAGMALCEVAAVRLGEDPEKAPWQSRQ